MTFIFEMANSFQFSRRLPFTNEVNAALGIAVKTYLDELSNDANPLFPETKERVKDEIPRMFSQSKVFWLIYNWRLGFGMRYATTGLPLRNKRANELCLQIIIGIKQAQKDNLVPDSN